MRTAILAAMTATLAGVVGMGALPNPHAPAPSPIPVTIVAIDDASLHALGPWPWNRRVHGRLVDALAAAGARSITFDVVFDTPSKNPSDDQALAAAIAKSPTPVSIAALPPMNGQPASMPIPPLAGRARILTAAVNPGADGLVTDIPEAVTINGEVRPSIAYGLARRQGMPVADRSMTIDWNATRERIPTISAADLLTGTGSREAIRGRDVVVAATAPSLRDLKATPGGSRIPGAQIQIMAAQDAAVR